MSSGPYHTNACSERSLEWDALPTVGADRHAGRGRSWRRITVALIGFWLVGGFALVLAAL